MKYPYAPPNLLSAVLLFIEAAVVWIGLRETLESRKYLRDRGMEVADTFRYWFRKIRFRLFGYAPIGAESTPDSAATYAMEETANTAITPMPPSTRNQDTRPLTKQRLPISRIWTPNVLFVLLTTAIFDFQMG